jgi:CRISPR-associated protein Cmr5
MPTRSQRLAHAAYARVNARGSTDRYTSFAKELPTLIHTCGLAQAVAFARAKGKDSKECADDLAGVLSEIGHVGFIDADQLSIVILSPRTSVAAYIRLSRDALAAAIWLKRHVEARAVAGQQ